MQTVRVRNASNVKVSRTYARDCDDGFFEVRGYLWSVEYESCACFSCLRSLLLGKMAR